jgi:DNA adenine methylase
MGGGMIPHPIPYQGSKRGLARKIMDYLPADMNRLIEPFAGSAALSLAVAYERKGRGFVLNDVNEPLIELWQMIIDQPAFLSAAYEKLWQAQRGQERRYYDLIRDRFNKTHRPYYLLYLLARCVKAAVRYNIRGEFNQSPDNRRSGRRPEAMRADIYAASELLRCRTQLQSGDYRDCLRLATSQDVIFMDPPYQGVGAARDPRYIHSVRFEEFVETLADLNQRQLAYIVSYDGRTGAKKYGSPLPEFLQLTHIELDAGRSSQATLLGRSDRTYESLYLSPILVSKLNLKLPEQATQLVLF